MKRESSARNCPFCDAKGTTNGEICDVCRGTKQIMAKPIRYYMSVYKPRIKKMFDDIDEGERRERGQRTKMRDALKKFRISSRLNREK